jgi:hypothetical protein
VGTFDVLGSGFESAIPFFSALIACEFSCKVFEKEKEKI